MTDVLADTSIFVASEAGRPIVTVPDGEVRIASVTLTELRIGVLLAPDPASRGRRARTLGAAQRLIPLGLEERVADALAEIVAALRIARRRVDLFDAVIAATAVTHGLPVWTQDADFARIAEVVGELEVLAG